MPVILGEKSEFPSILKPDSNGLVAIGGNLTPEFLIKAYSQGVFPWNEGGMPPFWFSPDPRMVLRPKEFKLSRSMRNILNRNSFKLKLNSCFKDVLLHCSTISRPGQEGTWLHEELKDSLVELHKEGYAHSLEVFHKEKLVGGLYGLKIGKIFFGESMFSLISNASKVALHSLCQMLPEDALIDCQQETEHLKTLGARSISREDFVLVVEKLKNQRFELAL